MRSGTRNPESTKPRNQNVSLSCFRGFVVSWFRVFVFFVFFVLLSAGALAWRQSPAPALVFPGAAWESIDRPESAGYSSKRLDAVRTWVASLDTTAMMVVVGGRSLVTYGDLTHLSYLASGRKSVLALLYGTHVDNGTIALNRTLADLKFTDVGGLLPRELDATVQHLLTARSGVYHRASNGGDDAAHAPPRGSEAPGARYLYNNWDFNAAGAVFERLTGRDIYDALDTDLARPLRMQDFDRTRQIKNGDMNASQHQAYPIWLSTRDMARVGLLALRGGRWGDRQLVPRDWVQRTTSLVSPWNDMDQAFDDSPPTTGRWGYGYLWWVWDAAGPADPLTGAFTAWGVGGQYITVIPRLDMVIAHKTDTAGRKGVTAAEYDATLHMILAARTAAREQTTTAASDEQAIRAAERQWNDSRVKADVATLGRLLADDWTVVHGDGTINTKAEYLADLKSGARTLAFVKQDNFSVRIDGDTAVAAGLSDSEGTYKGRPSGGALRFTRVYLKRNGRWLMIVSHATRRTP